LAVRNPLILQRRDAGAVDQARLESEAGERHQATSKNCQRTSDQRLTLPIDHSVCVRKPLKTFPGVIYSDRTCMTKDPRPLLLLFLLVLSVPDRVLSQDASTPAFVQVRIGDGVVLSGTVWSPRSTQQQTAIVITGPGEFYEYAEWGRRFAAAGFLAVSLNRRDSGAQDGYQLFEPSALDVRYAVDLAFQRGALRVVVVGPSYGSVVASYYLTAAEDARVSAAVLLSPLAELRAGDIRNVGEDRYNDAVKTARSMVDAGKGREVFITPGSAERTGRPTFTTYEVFLDKRGPDAKTVPAQLLKTVKVPVLAVRDPDDLSPGTLPPAQQRLEAASQRLTYVLLPAGNPGRSPGVIHRLGGREDEVVALILKWLAKNGL
jgi:pimeloyl-ACP methyl ester carboxylesterase